MKRTALFPVLAILALTDAVQSAPSGNEEILAEWNGRTITRTEVMQNVPAAYRDTVPSGAPEAWQKAVRETVYRQILIHFLNAHGLKPSPESALFFLEKLHRLMPPDPQNTAARRQELARDPDLQLNAAFFQYLNRHYPERMIISDEEAAAVYRAAPQKYVHHGRIVFGFLHFDGSGPAVEKKAWDVRARLLQGADFERIAAELNPRGTGELPPELAEAVRKAFPKPQKLQVSPPLTVQGKVYLVQIREYEPRRLSTLEESLPCIRIKLAFDRRVSRFMQEVLMQELERHPIRYCPPLSSI